MSNFLPDKLNKKLEEEKENYIKSLYQYYLNELKTEDFSYKGIFIYHKIPFLAETTDMIMRLRTVISFVVMTGISLLVYHFLPNRKLPFRDLILGSIFCSLGWLVISFVFSMYLTIFKGFSGLYGSMTAIILVMLWLYFCMYVMLLGGLINCIWVDAKRDILEKD